VVGVEDGVIRFVRSIIDTCTSRGSLGNPRMSVSVRDAFFQSAYTLSEAHHHRHHVRQRSSQLNARKERVSGNKLPKGSEGDVSLTFPAS
jgi:hypothetical protein